MDRVIAFIGPMGAGKTAAAQYLVDTRAAVRVSFADALKEVAMRVTPDGKIDKQRDRGLLQFLGTDYFREKIDQNYWVNQFKGKVTDLLMRGYDVVCDDCRFPNECEAIQQLGGDIVALNALDESIEERLTARDGAPTHGIKGHSSENYRALLPYSGLGIQNVGTLEELHAQLDAIW